MKISQTLMIHMMKVGQHCIQSHNLVSISSLEASYVLDMMDNDDPNLSNEDVDEDEYEDENGEEEEDNDGYEENSDSF